jgi:transposase
VDTPEGATMRQECPMAKQQQKQQQQQRRARRSFTPDFKAEAVRLCRVGDRSVPQVAKDLDLTETALREWVKQAAVDAGAGQSDAITTEEREELRELRKRVKRLEQEREILKKAAAFFAKESS